MFSFLSSPKASRYVSMRVHGHAAHLQYETPDLPEIERVTIARSPDGISVSTNYPARLQVYVSIPTPLVVERQFSLAAIFRSIFDRSTEKIFKNTQVKVVRVEMFYTMSHTFSPDEIEVMDGNRRLAKQKIADIPLVDANSDAYLEAPAGNFILPLNHEVKTALGVVLWGHFTDAAYNADNYFHLTAAKAVFAEKT